ncbi:hypothetical protein ACFWFK_26430 [Micromonospora chalcea]
MPESDELSVLIVRCEGIQVGRWNKQFIVYDFRVRTPKIDLGVVLNRPDVREALNRLAADTENERLRQRAQEALGTEPWSMIRRRAVTYASTQPLRGNKPEVALPLFRSNVVAIGSKAVQIGNHQRQHLQFVQTLDAHIDLPALLSQNPSLTSEVIDAVISNRYAHLPSSLGKHIGKAVPESPAKSVRMGGGAHVALYGVTRGQVGSRNKQVVKLTTQVVRQPPFEMSLVGPGRRGAATA